MERSLPSRCGGIEFPMIRSKSICPFFAISFSFSQGTAGADERGWLASFEHDAAIKLELFAAEPQVLDPVAICFGPDGVCYAAEMRDYPLGMLDGKPGGRVRRLRDLNGDGRADEAIIFADGLNYPTSLTPWRGGVMVMAPPEIIYLEDTNGDGVAEVRRVVASGFPRGVTDSNVNGLRFGTDGRIHGVNGGNGGRIGSPLAPGRPSVDLGRLDFVINPDSGEIATTSETGGGFGLVFDDWGRSFTSHNREYLMQRVIPQEYLEGIPVSRWLGPFTTFIARDGHGTRLFPRGDVQTRVNHPEQAGHFSAGSVPCYLGDSPFGKGGEKSILTCDQTSGLIHRDILSDQAAVAVAVPTNADGKEFLASKDNAFRPTALEHGPDGAIYLADMQRDVIEHPDYIPAAVKKKLDLRAGQDRGRIWRLVPASGLPSREPAMAGATIETLVAALGSKIPWRRETAQRLLLERADPAAVGPLSVLAGHESAPLARVRALWLLAAAGRLEMAMVQSGLNSAVGGVRLNALKLAGNLLKDQAPAAALLKALEDPVPMVRLQAALTLGKLAVAERPGPLLKVLQSTEDPWLRRAALIGLGPKAPAALKQALEGPERRPPDAALEMLARLAMAYGVDPAVLETGKMSNAVIAGLAASAGPPAPGPAAVWSEKIGAWASALPESAQPALLDLAGALKLPVPAALEGQFAKAEKLALDPALEDSLRVRAIALLARGRSAAPLLALLEGSSSAVIQQAVVGALQRFREIPLGAELLTRWPTINPAVRPVFIALFVDYRPWHDALLTALEKGTILFGELNLDLEQRREFIKEGPPAERQRALKHFDDHEWSNRKASVAALLSQLPAKGDPKTGLKIFTERCQLCHSRGKTGHPVGPDLLGMNHRSTEDLLSHIVDPSMAIHPNYVGCTVVTESGERHTGLLRDESVNSVSILMPLGVTVTVPRRDLKNVTTLNRSLMPEGLENALTPLELKGLIEFLQSPN